MSDGHEPNCVGYVTALDGCRCACTHMFPYWSVIPPSYCPRCGAFLGHSCPTKNPIQPQWMPQPPRYYTRDAPPQQRFYNVTNVTNTFTTAKATT